MALPIVHLLAAQSWAKDKPALAQCPEFYLGAISPDGIHIRDGKDKSRKNEIHLGNWGALHPERVYEYWTEHFSPFDIGYGIHVLTDAFWGPMLRRQLPELLSPEGRVRTDIYYSDTQRTDFDLLAHVAEAADILDLIARAEVPQAHPLLTKEELGAWRATVLEYYRRPCPVNAPAVYVTEAYVQEFLRQARPFLCDITRRFFPMSNPVLQAIADRRSTRGFSPEQLTQEQLNALLDAAVQSPSAVNRQPWHFSVVQDMALLDEFNEVQRGLIEKRAPENERGRFSDPAFNVFYKAPTVIFISLPVDHGFFAPIDAGIAVENIALAAHSLGLGSVILGMPKEVFDSEFGDKYRKAFQFPEGNDFAIAISVGHNTVTKEAHEVKPDKISIVR